MGIDCVSFFPPALAGKLRKQFGGQVFTSVVLYTVPTSGFFFTVGMSMLVFRSYSCGILPAPHPGGGSSYFVELGA